MVIDAGDIASGKMTVTVAETCAPVPSVKLIVALPVVDGAVYAPVLVMLPLPADTATSRAIVRPMRRSSRCC